MAKTVNYTPEQTAKLVEAYKSMTNDGARAEVIRDFAGMFGKSAASIRAKLSREGVYVKAETAGKKGGVKKNDVANAIGAVLQMTDGETDSLAKANLTALNKVWRFIRAESGEVGEDASQ